jgi:pimeloyl-ACP methyl ester carboxylesterase
MRNIKSIAIGYNCDDGNGDDGDDGDDEGDACTIQKAVQHVKMVIVDKAGHWLQQDQPQIVNQCISDFVYYK